MKFPSTKNETLRFAESLFLSIHILICYYQNFKKYFHFCIDIYILMMYYNINKTKGGTDHQKLKLKPKKKNQRNERYSPMDTDLKEKKKKNHYLR